MPITKQQLQTEFERILPDLEQLSKEEAEKRASLEESSQGAGHSFTKDYERISRVEYVLKAQDYWTQLIFLRCRSRKLGEAIDQLAKLAEKLDISGLSKAPL
jgi:hypothetical protein